MLKRIYFSQDLEDLRADEVRKLCMATPGVEGTGFFEAMSESTMAGPSTIRRQLTSALDNTQVTCVLIGTQTASRRWVRYEIIESLQRRNVLFGVHINGVPDKSQQTKPKGPDPFQQLALAIAEDGGSVKVLLYTNGAWLQYDDNPGWPLANSAPPARRGKRIQLSTLYRVYDWVADNGAENFEKWIGV